MCMTLQLSAFRPQTQPIDKLLQGSPVLSGEGVRLIVRSYFVSSGFTSVLVLGMPCSNSEPASKPSRPHVSDSLGHCEQLQEFTRMVDYRVSPPVPDRFDQHGVGVFPIDHRFAGTQIAPGCCQRRHPGSSPGEASTISAPHSCTGASTPR